MYELGTSCWALIVRYGGVCNMCTSYFIEGGCRLMVHSDGTFFFGIHYAKVIGGVTCSQGTLLCTTSSLLSAFNLLISFPAQKAQNIPERSAGGISYPAQADLIGLHSYKGGAWQSKRSLQVPKRKVPRKTKTWRPMRTQRLFLTYRNHSPLYAAAQ